MSKGYGNGAPGSVQGDEQPQSHINVITMSGDVIEMDLPSTSTVKDLKHALQTMTSEPTYCSKVVFGVHVLSN